MNNLAAYCMGATPPFSSIIPTPLMQFLEVGGEMDLCLGGRSHLYPEYPRRLFLEVLQRAEGEELQQAGGAIKYFIITGVSYSSPSTTLTLYGGTDYDLANSAIIEPYFSMAKTPYCFPLDKARCQHIKPSSRSAPEEASVCPATLELRPGAAVQAPGGRNR